jgi:hypothetical protein
VGRAALLLAIAVVAVGCSSSSDGDGSANGTKPPAGCTEGTPGCFGWTTCPPEMTPDPDVGGCREILPAAECAAGTMAVLGAAECQPVGPSSCPDGFVKASSGWGCEAVIPAAACTGATRDAVGSATCVPVGDCNAPFPPADATLFVSPTATVDATHFTTIGAALAAATIGSVIAVDSGTYAEGIDAKSNAVSVIGRCPEKVRLVGTGQDVWGVIANGVKNLKVSGVTLVDHYEGARAQNGTMFLTDVVFESPRSSGMIAWPAGSSIHAERVVIRNVKPHPTKQSAAVLAVNADEGGTVELVDSAVTGSWAAGIVATNPTDLKHTSTLSLDRVVVRDTNLGDKDTAGAAVVVADHSHGDVKDSVITDTKRLGVLALGDGATLTVTGSVVRRSLEDATGDTPSGAAAFEGGHLDLTDTTLSDNAELGATSEGKGSRISMTRVAVVGSKPSPTLGDFGIGAWANDGGELALDTTALVGNAYYGVGANAAGTKVTLSSVLVKDTATDKNGAFGRGLNIEYGAEATLDKVTVEGGGDEGIFVRGQNKDGSRAAAAATRILVRDLTGGSARSSGTGIAVERGAVLTLDTAAVIHAITSGIELNEIPGDAGDTSTATITNTIVRDTVGGKDGVVGATGEALSGLGIACGGVLDLSKSSVIGSRQFGIVVANPTASASIANAIVTGTQPGKVSDTYGHGIVAIGAGAAIVKDSVVAANVAGLAFDRSAGIVAGTVVRQNAVGINVQGDGFSLVTAPKAPDLPPDGNTVVVSDDSRFVDNGTRIGSGAIPLPSDPLAGATTDTASNAPKR